MEQSAYNDIALYQDQGKDRQNKHSCGLDGIVILIQIAELANPTLFRLLISPQRLFSAIIRAF